MDFQAEQEINKQACSQTKEYLRLHCMTDNLLLRTKTMLVYKFLATPEYLLTKAMNQMDSNSLKSYYKNLALHLHPDKNPHPQAKEAFQKISNVFRSIYRA